MGLRVLLYANKACNLLDPLSPHLQIFNICICDLDRLEIGFLLEHKRINTKILAFLYLWQLLNELSSSYFIFYVASFFSISLSVIIQNHLDNTSGSS